MIWCNGNTTDFDSVISGSNPGVTSKIEVMKAGSLLAMASMMSGVLDWPLSSSNEKNPLRPEDIDVTPKEPVIQKGMRKFVIEGVEVYAINENNAIKKYNKQHK